MTHSQPRVVSNSLRTCSGSGFSAAAIRQPVACRASLASSIQALTVEVLRLAQKRSVGVMPTSLGRRTTRTSRATWAFRIGHSANRTYLRPKHLPTFSSRWASRIELWANRTRPSSRHSLPSRTTLVCKTEPWASRTERRPRTLRVLSSSWDFRTAPLVNRKSIRPRTSPTHRQTLAYRTGRWVSRTCSRRKTSLRPSRIGRSSRRSLRASTISTEWGCSRMSQIAP